MSSRDGRLTMRRRVKRLGRRDWRPARLVHGDIIALTATLVAQASIRAYDYGTGADGTGRSLALVERAAPLWVWALIFAAGDLCLIAGMVRRCHMAVWAGHVSLAIAYLVLTVGILIPTLVVPWADGIRAASVLLTPMILHWIFSLRMGPRPMEPAHVVPAEVVGAPDAE